MYSRWILDPIGKRKIQPFARQQNKCNENDFLFSFLSPDHINVERQIHNTVTFPAPHEAFFKR